MSLTKSQYQKILREYDELQYQSQRELEEHQAEIRKKVPRIAEIDQEIISLGSDAARARLQANTERSKRLISRIHTLSAEKSRLLTENGYPTDYLTRHYRCKDCHDTGFVGTLVCHCMAQRSIDLLYRQSNLGDVLKKENFDTFSWDCFSDDDFFKDDVSGETPLSNMKQVVPYCQDFSKKFDKTGENLVLYGNTGVGKTFLTHCIARDALNRAKSVIYLSAGALFDELSKHSFSNMKDQDEEAEAGIYHCDLLIIDDLGTELVNTFTIASLFQCLNTRLAAKKSIVISTNLSPTGLREVYTERISSRITGNFTFIKLFGADIRTERRMRAYSEALSGS
ncbi:MAG: ATP-binding protein [Lachnospiraceae bacterium]|nr:ATP-binding protein [Lachnospiraceae bacterium]